MPEDILKHIGTYYSGRYPRGSGGEPNQSSEFFTKYRELKKAGKTPKEIATEMGINTAQLRTNITWARNEQKADINRWVGKMREDGMTDEQIGKEFNVSASTIRNYRSNKEVHQEKQLDTVRNALKDQVDKVTHLDVGAGVEVQLKIPRTRLKAVMSKMVEEDGYYLHDIYVRRVGDNQKPTTVKVLTKEPDVKVVKQEEIKIRSFEGWSDDGGETINNINPPKSVDPKRVQVRYAEDGGKLKDGVIEMRPSSPDLDMGGSRYAQVRIKVGADRYLKGMAVYGDEKDFPKGVDMIFNTNKSNSIPKMDVLKKTQEGELSKFGDNMFGGAIMRQNKSNVLNIVNEEGTWDTWSNHLASQFLSKQPLILVKDRLEVTHTKLKNDLDEIKSIDNPIVKQYLLDAYSKKMVTKVARLEVEGLPRTKSHVILPFPEIKPDQIYAPHYDDGDRVVLIRYPHGGTFEIPELTVNNRSPKAKKMLGNAPDAVGIHPSVAEKLSGADFDGDTVTVIRQGQGATKIKTSRSLDALKNFDPMIYKMPKVKMTEAEEKTYKLKREKAKEIEMGKASNLITDMTIKDASESEIAKAVKYSMVVIDSAKHNLDYRQAGIDNSIKSLKLKYQLHEDPISGKKSIGASTLISRSKRLIKRMDKEGIDITSPEFTPEKYSSGRQVEVMYLGYIKKVRALKGDADKTSMSTTPPKYSPEAAKAHAEEVDSLDTKLKTAKLNAPRERQAQILSNKIYYSNVKSEMDEDQKKKLKNRSLSRARATVGARGREAIIELSPKEWTAIQKHAISNTRLKEILKYADMDIVKKMATPRTPKLNSSQINKAKALLATGKYTYAQVSEQLGITISRQALIDG